MPPTLLKFSLETLVLWPVVPVSNTIRSVPCRSQSVSEAMSRRLLLVPPSSDRATRIYIPWICEHASGGLALCVLCANCSYGSLAIDRDVLRDQGLLQSVVIVWSDRSHLHGLWHCHLLQRTPKRPCFDLDIRSNCCRLQCMSCRAQGVTRGPGDLRHRLLVFVSAVPA